MKLPKTASGFTLIELLIAIAIIIALAGIAIYTYPGVRQTARDTRRKSDIRQYQAAVETFANRSNNLYPSYGSVTNISTLCPVLGITSNCVDDPTPTIHYRYISAGGGAAGSATATSYVLFTNLEKPVAGVNQYWVTCSNGNVGRIPVSSWTPSATCPGGLQQ